MFSIKSRETADGTKNTVLSNISVIFFEQTNYAFI